MLTLQYQERRQCVQTLTFFSKDLGADDLIDSTWGARQQERDKRQHCSAESEQVAAMQSKVSLTSLIARKQPCIVAEADHDGYTNDRHH